MLNSFQHPLSTKKWTQRQAQSDGKSIPSYSRSGYPEQRDVLNKRAILDSQIFAKSENDKAAFTGLVHCVRNDNKGYTSLRALAKQSRRAATGRSMVEMLGVLAIIGVLSIGALAGYRAAITRHKVNSILADVSLGLTDLKTQDRADTNFGAFNFRTESGYTITGKQSASGYAYVKVEGVEESVCEKLLAFKNTGNYGEIYSDDNGTNALNECTADALTTMVFAEKNTVAGGDDNNEIAEPACAADSDCNNHGTCSDGQCVCDNGWKGAHCLVVENSNICSDGTVCDEGQICDSSNQCSSCAAGKTPYCEYYWGGCESVRCCSGVVKETADGIQACCVSDDQVAYCYEYTQDDLCYRGICVETGCTPYCEEYYNGSCALFNCCSGTPYQWWYTEDGAYYEEKCCPAAKFVKEVADGIQACCDSDDQVAYCYYYDNNARCQMGACCSGTVTKDEDGQDVCTP